MTPTGLVRAPQGSLQAKLRALKVGDGFPCDSYDARKYAVVARRLGIKLQLKDGTMTRTK